MDAAFAMNQRLGIDVVKTGYVCDAGQMERRLEDGTIAREWHDGQWSSNHHLRVLESAARHQVAINTHEPIKDTGLRRTWPNWVSREGARGMEYAAWGNPPNPPEHEANLLFTRMLSGPMDFTPGILSLQGRGQPVQTTWPSSWRCTWCCTARCRWSPTCPSTTPAMSQVPRTTPGRRSATPSSSSSTSPPTGRAPKCWPARSATTPWSRARTATAPTGTWARSPTNTAARCRSAVVPGTRPPLHRPGLPRRRRRALEGQAVCVRARDPRSHQRRYPAPAPGCRRRPGHPLHPR